MQCVVPSNLMGRRPRVSLAPYRQWQDWGCRVYGILDGWQTHVGSLGHYQLSLLYNPRQIREDITRFWREGADGIFVHQADGHLADPFARPVINWRNWA